jgi:hypothetical protein
VVSSKPQSLYPRQRSHRYPLDRTLNGPQNRSGRGGEKKNLAFTGIWTPNPQPSSPVASRYTDCAIPAPPSFLSYFVSRTEYNEAHLSQFRLTSQETQFLYNDLLLSLQSNVKYQTAKDICYLYLRNGQSYSTLCTFHRLSVLNSVSYLKQGNEMKIIRNYAIINNHDLLRQLWPSFIPWAKFLLLCKGRLVYHTSIASIFTVGG